MARSEDAHRSGVPRGTFAPKAGTQVEREETLRTHTPTPWAEGEAWHEPGLRPTPEVEAPPAPKGVATGPRARTRTLLGVTSAPPELLAQARAQRGSHPAPPSFEEVRRSLAAQEAPLDSLDVPFTAAASSRSPSEPAAEPALAAPLAPAEEPLTELLDGEIDAAFAPYDGAQDAVPTQPMSEVLAEEAGDDALAAFVNETTPVRHSAVLSEPSEMVEIDHPPGRSARPRRETPLVAVPPAPRAPEGATPPPPPRSRRPSPSPSHKDAGSLAPAVLGSSLAPSEAAPPRRKGGPWPIVLAAAAALIGAFMWAYTRPGSQVAAANESSGRPAEAVGSTAPEPVQVAASTGVQASAPVAEATGEPSPTDSNAAVLPVEVAQGPETGEATVAAVPKRVEKVGKTTAAERPAKARAAGQVAAAKARASTAVRRRQNAAAEPTGPGAATSQPSAPIAEPATPEPETPQASMAEAKGAPVLRIVPLDQHLPALPSRADVEKAMRGIRDKVAECAAGHRGVARVTVTAQSSGKLNYVLVGGDFAGKPQGSCIARTIRTARLPAFEEPQFEFTYPFSF